MAQTEQILRKTLETIAAERKLEKPDIEIKALTTEGANYSSEIYKVTISSMNSNTLNAFAKVASVPEKMREGMKNADAVYETERLFYTEFVPMFESLQDKYGFPAKSRLKFPKYYGCNPKRLEETIVLEDLAVQGYTLYDRLKPLDLAYASRAIEELAKLHALSFAYKHHYPEMYAKNYSRYDCILGEMQLLMKDSFKGLAENLYKQLPENLKQRVQSFVEEQLTEESVRKYYGPGKWAILIHGDYRASNIMHKSQGIRVISLIPLDYQTMYLGSPSIDLLYLLYTGTDEALRRDHLPQLLDLYYGILSKWLRQMDMDPDAVFSRKDFDEDFKNMLPFGLKTAILLLPVILVDPNDAPTMDADDVDTSMFVVKTTDRYAKRIIPIINEFIKWGVI